MSNELFEQLEETFQNVLDEDQPTPVTELTDEQLREEFVELTEEIKTMRQVLTPRTQHARDVHSRRNAIQVEMRKRQ